MQNTNKQGDSQEYDRKWKPPKVGCMKINVDAAVIKGQNWFALGMVVRDHFGQYIIGKTMKFSGEVSVVEA